MNNLTERDYRSEPKVAIYWDFENVHISLSQLEGYDEEPWKVQQAIVNVTSIMDYAASVGEVCVNRAYGNWRYYGKYAESLSIHGVELIQLFPLGQRGKNGADIKMCVDVVEDLVRLPHIDVYVVVTGDSDFVSIAQKIRQYGKRVIGIGIRERTSRFWVQVCNEFKFYDLLQRREALSDLAPSEGADPSDELPAAQALLVSVIRRLATQAGESWVPKASVKPLILRVDPGFDESRFGFPTFTAFIASCANQVEDAGDKLQLIGEAAAAQSAEPTLQDRAKWERLLVAAMTFLLRKGNDQVPMASLKPMLQRLEPSFDQHSLGFPSLLAFLKQFPDQVDVLGEGTSRYLVLKVEPNDGGFTAPVAAVSSAPPPEIVAAAIPFHTGSLKRHPASSWVEYYQRLTEAVQAAGFQPEEKDIKGIQGLLWRSHSFWISPDKTISIRDELAVDGQLAAHLDHYAQSLKPKAQEL